MCITLTVNYCRIIVKLSKKIKRKIVVYSFFYLYSQSEYIQLFHISTWSK